ncbi:carbonic anhydrase [Streptomyces sp. LX-29]|uniref:carbonic anhydrase n=1 Tax=Streptomyces sp. LX-29 TaxID=2900152 RepID=UPI00240D2DDE|nr:carbonic anhydrase [Streptomyces sp. LX-29]WFB11052.1 carbonic anhydrase [Streptomyces sp. LX-29]
MSGDAGGPPGVDAWLRRRQLMRAGVGGVVALGTGSRCGASAASSGAAAVVAAADSRRVAADPRGTGADPCVMAVDPRGMVAAPCGMGARPGTPEAALRALAAGNRRWRTFRERHPDQGRAVRESLAGGQHPFAVVLGCVDSRVPPELVFDQGLGDLLTVRSAGEVLDEAVLGSIAYGVLELGVPLVVVLGHQSCGAVSAAVRADEGGSELSAHVRYLTDQIRPVIDRTLQGDARVDAAITANVRRVRSRLASESDLAAKITAGVLDVVGARYELTSQRVHRVR